ncbi:MAG: hypothetical protein KDB58_10285 [Solirubrobacterales bacterium]|nr:hypothetical protein [Solirubrobacterales bacterium]MCB8969506.1 hypothetical protein [Thermoleophilales bacterium]
MAEGRLTLISAVGGEQGYLALTSDEEGTRVIRQEGDETAILRADEMVGGSEGRIEMVGEDASLELSWSPAGPMLAFEMGAGEVRVHGIAASAAGAGGSLSGPGVLWDLPLAGVALLRTVWAATSKGSLTVLIGVRTDARDEHGEEVVGGARMLPGAEPYGYDEPLLSTEYDGEGEHVRATLELWPHGDEHQPERGAGLRICGAADDGPGGSLHAARFGWSVGGEQGVGAYEILRP